MSRLRLVFLFQNIQNSKPFYESKKFQEQFLGYLVQSIPKPTIRYHPQDLGISPWPGSQRRHTEHAKFFSAAPSWPGVGDHRGSVVGHSRDRWGASTINVWYVFFLTTHSAILFAMFCVGIWSGIHTKISLGFYVVFFLTSISAFCLAFFLALDSAFYLASGFGILSAMLSRWHRVRFRRASRIAIMFGPCSP